jgi:hypothetical protein
MRRRPNRPLLIEDLDGSETEGTVRFRLDGTEVCERANAQGIEVKDRGRVPAALVARFNAAILK